MSIVRQWTCFLWSPPRDYVTVSDSGSKSKEKWISVVWSKVESVQSKVVMCEIF
jgi:hypothetical protein